MTPAARTASTTQTQVGVLLFELFVEVVVGVVGWTVDGRDGGTDNMLTLTMDADHTVVAHFATTPGQTEDHWIYLPMIVR